MRSYKNLIVLKVHLIGRSTRNYKINKTHYHNCFISNDKKLITNTKAVI